MANGEARSSYTRDARSRPAPPPPRTTTTTTHLLVERLVVVVGDAAAHVRHVRVGRALHVELPCNHALEGVVVSSPSCMVITTDQERNERGELPRHRAPSFRTLYPPVSMRIVASMSSHTHHMILYTHHMILSCRPCAVARRERVVSCDSMNCEL